MGSGSGKVLVRPRDDRMFAGVCAGLANYSGLDVTVVRVLWAVGTVVTGGAGILAYLVAWILIPDEGRARPPADRPASERQDTWTG